MPLDVVVEKLMHSLFTKRVERIGGGDHERATHDIERDDESVERDRLGEHLHDSPVNFVILEGDIGEFRSLENAAEQRLQLRTPAAHYFVNQRRANLIRG